MNWKDLSSSPCNLCPRECLVDRKSNQTGYCQESDRIYVARAALHMWEEPCISGKTGSGTVFFSGCNLRCIYCQNFQIATGQKGKEVSIQRLGEIFLELQQKGASNINLVTPDHYIRSIAEALLNAKRDGLRIPIVYNGSGYEKKQVIEKLEGIIDIFLTDFKYMDGELAKKYSFAQDYPQVAAQALEQMVKQTGEPIFDEAGMLLRGVIVRHLLLPGHKRNAKAVLKYVYETYGNKVYISLMNQYTPLPRMREAAYENLRRKVTKREYEEVINYALELGITNAYIQEGQTAKESFIPEFDGVGV